MDSWRVVLFLAVAVVICAVVCAAEDAVRNQDVAVNEEDVEYAKNSVCQYCKYCEYCEFCDEQCPCKKTKRQPACGMCKYCTCCKLCRVCDTVCQPGGIIDTVTGKLLSMLPSIDEESVGEDLDEAQKYIDRYNRILVQREERRKEHELRKQKETATEATVPKKEATTQTTVHEHIEL